MSDNIIKMFIGGEEVVSNKEFTINEEMLSASSTILNNCYPASWELTKDYVSNFYYPKDYSKFILGKGNFTYGTDQYYVLTVSGESFMQFTTNVEKEWNNFNVYGNTTQETAEIKNLWLLPESASSNGITYTENADGTFNLSGTATANTAFLSWLPLSFIEDNTNYTLHSSYMINGLEFRFEEYTAKNGTWIKQYNFLSNTTDNPRTRQVVKSTGTYVRFAIYIANGTTINQSNIQIQLEKGSQATAFQPFGAMPSPYRPSELISVGYENLFQGGDTSTINGIIFTKNDDGSYDITGTATANANLYNFIDLDNIDLTDGGVYILSLNQQLQAGINIAVEGYNGNTWVRALVGTITSNTVNNQQFGAIDLTNVTRVRFGIKVTNGSIINMTNLKMVFEKGNIAHSYIPYSKYGIEIKTINKNLLNIDGTSVSQGLTNITTDTIIKVNGTSTNTYSTIVSQKAQEIPIGTYTFSIQEAYNKRIGFIARFDDNTEQTYNINANQLSTTFTTTKKILSYRLYMETIIGNTYDLTIKPQLEKGTVGTNFEKNKTNIYTYVLDNPLRKVGTYKDKLYIENGILYIERKIGHIVLNGSENWNNDAGTVGTNYRHNLKFENNNLPLSISTRNGLSNYFHSNYISVNGAFEAGEFYANGEWIVIWDIYQKYNLAGFKSWLSSHNTEINYVLVDSYIEELGQVDMPNSYNGINNIFFYTGLETTEDVNYYWKNYDVLFAGIVKNSGDISLRPTDPKYCSLQILDYKTFLSESDTLDFVISEKTIAEAISMVVDAISGYGFILGTINISQADDIIGAYSTLNKTAYDVFQYLANISGSRWRARFVDSDTMAIDFYDPELLPRANDIDYTQQYWEDNKIVDLTFNYGTRDYRNKQIILSDEVYGGIDYTEVLLSNGYGTSYITQNNIANITSITVNGVEAEVITQSEKDLGVDADFYYTPGKNVVESTTSYTAGTQIIITYTPLVKGRQIVYNDEEVTRIATQTNTTGVISRYESRNDILSSDELENIAETYIKYKGKPEIILTLTTLNNDLFNIGEICYFNSPIADLAQDYMVKSKATNYTTVAGETNIFYTYELTSSFNSEKAINYFDNQRNKATGNIAEGESITRNIDINNSAMIIWENATITEISVSVDGDNALNSVLNSPFIQ